jgi:hypothetical protein
MRKKMNAVRNQRVRAGKDGDIYKLVLKGGKPSSMAEN